MKSAVWLKLAGLLVLSLFVFSDPAAAHNLIICKDGPSGSSATFNVRNVATGWYTNVYVAAGQCVDLGDFSTLPLLQITENVPTGFEVTGITVSPSGDRRTCSTALPNRVCVQIGEHTTTVRFTNARIEAAHNLVICKVGRGGAVGSYTFTVKNTSTGATRTVDVSAGHCLDLGDYPIGTIVQITETVPTGQQIADIAVSPSGDRVSCSYPASNRVCVCIGEHTTTVTFTNEPIPREPICTFTKGYYRNHESAVSAIISGLGGSLTVGGAARTAAQIQAILKATPGKPGNVTFSSNLLLNTTQQLITALLNLRGNTAAAPTAVRNAILAAQAGIQITIGGGGQIQIGTTLSQLGSLTGTLSDFNEGKYAGYPHCDDD